MTGTGRRARRAQRPSPCRAPQAKGPGLNQTGERPTREAQGLDIDLRVLPDAGHGGADFMKGENRQAIVDFLTEHLKQ